MLAANVGGDRGDGVGAEVAVRAQVVVLERVVLAHVLGDRAGVRAPVIAVRTLVRLLARVGPLVLDQIAQPHRDVRAVLALVALRVRLVGGRAVGATGPAPSGGGHPLPAGGGGRGRGLVVRRATAQWSPDVV